MEKRKTMEQHALEVFDTPLDRRLISQMKKGGETLDYVSGSAVIHLLKKAFGPIFSVEYSQPWEHQYETIKDKDGQEYVPKKVLEVKCRITVPIYSDELQQVVTVVHEGFGTCVMKKKFEEMMLKTAETDALKKAASKFGIDAELRIKKNPDEYEYFAENVYGIWTSELIKKYKTELAAIRDYMKQHGIRNQDEMAVRTIGESRLTPKNIRQVVGKMHLTREDAA